MCHNTACSRQGSRVRILVVEDSAAQRLVVCHMLQSLGHDVVAVGDAETALTTARQAAFDVVLSDITLPGLSGTDLLHQLRLTGGPTAQARMIAMSAAKDQTADAAMVLQKPVTKRALVQALAGDAGLSAPTKDLLIDPAQLARLQSDLGRDVILALLRRFVTEAEMVFAQKMPDKMMLHQLAGSAGLFGARALHAAVLAGAWQTIWPATRAALLAMMDQTA
jgi:CheY-like chemotaxis protein